MTTVVPSPATQARLMARLVAAIHGIVDALIPFIGGIVARPTRPWIERARLSGSFYAVIRELLALTTRIRPDIFARTPPAAPSRPDNAAPTPACRQPRLPGRAEPHRAGAPISARNLARRLAILLHQLVCLAAEARTALPARLCRQVTRARAIARCEAYPIRLPYRARAG